MLIRDSTDGVQSAAKDEDRSVGILVYERLEYRMRLYELIAVKLRGFREFSVGKNTFVVIWSGYTR